MYLKYVGKKAEEKDHLYGTGTVWGHDDIQNVPEAAARKMLKHTDVWATPTPEEVAAHGLPATPPRFRDAGLGEPPIDELLLEEDTMHNVNLGSMTKANLAIYAHRAFGVELDANMPINDMRAKVRELRIEQGIRTSART